MPDRPAPRPEPAGPAVLADGGVYVPPALAYPLWLALRARLDRHRADGGQLRPEAVAALEALRSAALAHMSANQRGPRTSAHHRPRELICTEQLADRLGVSTRHARRLAARHGVTPASRNAWHPDDADHLTQLRRTP